MAKYWGPPPFLNMDFKHNLFVYDILTSGPPPLYDICHNFFFFFFEGVPKFGGTPHFSPKIFFPNGLKWILNTTCKNVTWPPIRNRRLSQVHISLWRTHKNFQPFIFLKIVFKIHFKLF